MQQPATAPTKTASEAEGVVIVYVGGRWFVEGRKEHWRKERVDWGAGGGSIQYLRPTERC